MLREPTRAYQTDTPRHDTLDTIEESHSANTEAAAVATVTAAVATVTAAASPCPLTNRSPYQYCSRRSGLLMLACLPSPSSSSRVARKWSRRAGEPRTRGGVMHVEVFRGWSVQKPPSSEDLYPYRTNDTPTSIYIAVCEEPIIFARLHLFPVREQ